MQVHFHLTGIRSLITHRVYHLQVSLPEASDFIARAPAVLSLTNLEDNVSFLEGLKTEARQAGVWLEAGIHTQSPDPQRVFNAHVLIDPQGALVQTYHKTHLFDVDIQGGTTILESRTTVPGDDLVPPQTTSVGRVGLLTCYDLRFPEPALRLRREGAELLTYPSAFTTRTGGAHWEVLLRARAIETQCYVLASAQTGTHFASEVHPEDGKTILPARQSYGHALIVDPWGTVVAQVADNPNQQEEPAFAIAE